jgi:hypothetical protein
MKRIENLNTLSGDNLIMDDKKRIFVVRQISRYAKFSTCHLDLTELNEEFTNWSVTLPAACDEDYLFVSKEDKDFQFKFYETNVSKKDVTKLLADGLKKILTEINNGNDT